MPLSEEELRLLEQMERALVEEDPKFASTLRGTALRHSARRRAIAAGFVFAVGIALLFVGVLTEWYVGIAGFVLMLVSATIALGAFRGHQAATSDPRGSTLHPSGLTSIDGGRRSRRADSKQIDLHFSLWPAARPGQRKCEGTCFILFAGAASVTAVAAAASQTFASSSLGAAVWQPSRG